MSDEQYIGTYIAGKTRILGVGSGKTVKVPESEWIKIPDHHPAIVEKTVFDTVKANIGKRGEPLRRRKLGTSERYKHIKSPLQGKVFCGCCGHTMKLSSTRNAAFHCDFTRAAPDAECHRLKMLASELEAVVFKQLRGQARAILKSANASSHAVPSTGLETQITQIGEVLRGLYERYILGEINADEYKAEKADIEAELLQVKNAQSILTKEAERKAAVIGFRQAAEDVLNAKTLSRSVADVLIDRINVYPVERVEIVWKVTAETKMTEVKAYV